MDPVLQTIPSRGPGEVPPPHPALKPLWIAIGVLGVAVVALGGTLVYQHVQDAPSGASVAALSAPAAPLPAPAVAPSIPAPAIITEEKAPPPPAVASAPPVVQAPRAPAGLPPSSVPTYTPQGVIPPGTTTTANTAPPAYAPGTYGTAPVASAGGAVCASCGRVESVTSVHRSAPPSGIGAVAGGVLGAVVGNQIGSGGGRTAATLLGAGGGAYVGNRIEANRNTHTVYMVHVRMDNGTRRTFERAEPVQVGSPVTVQGHGFRLGREESYSTAPAPQAPVSQAGTYSTVRN